KRRVVGADRQLPGVDERQIRLRARAGERGLALGERRGEEAERGRRERKEDQFPHGKASLTQPRASSAARSYAEPGSTSPLRRRGAEIHSRFPARPQGPRRSRGLTKRRLIELVTTQEVAIGDPPFVVLVGACPAFVFDSDSP